jgi:ribosomal protein S15P/S13E
MVRQPDNRHEQLQKLQIDGSLRSLLPRACDRFEEARFFVQLLASLEPSNDNRDVANWCLGAHFSAYIGIDHASKHDIASDGSRDEYASTSLSKEFWLRSNDTNPWSRDPLAINRLYRDLRNIRVHVGEKLVDVDDRRQLSDISSGRQIGLLRWYLRKQLADSYCWMTCGLIFHNFTTDLPGALCKREAFCASGDPSM